MSLTKKKVAARMIRTSHIQPGVGRTFTDAINQITLLVSQASTGVEFW